MRRISRTLGCVVIALAASASLAGAETGPSGRAETGSTRPESMSMPAADRRARTRPERSNSTLAAATGRTRHGDVSCLSVSGNTAIIGFGEGYFRLLVPMQTYWVTGLVRIVDKGATGDTFEYVELQTGETEPHLPPPTGDPLPGPTDCSSFPSDRHGLRHRLWGASRSPTGRKSEPRRISASTAVEAPPRSSRTRASASSSSIGLIRRHSARRAQREILRGRCRRRTWSCTTGRSTPSTGVTSRRF